MVYLFVLHVNFPHMLAGKCTKIYNACKTIARLIIKPLLLRRFCCRCGLCKISAVVVYKKSWCRLISVLFLLYLWFKPRSHWKIPNEQLSSSTLEKDCAICPWKFMEIRPRIFGRMVSAHGLGRAYRKAVFLARSSDNKSARYLMESLPKRNLDLTSFSLKYLCKCALKSLKRRGLARLAWARRPNSNGSTIFFSQIYPWNSDLLLLRKV